MKEHSEQCFICGGKKFDQHTKSYRRCTTCGHEVLVTVQKQSFIINDELSKKSIQKITGLDRFKSKTLASCARGGTQKHLVDIGSASGKFIYHHTEWFERATGIEVTPEALAFSRENLGLHIVEGIDQVAEGVDMITAWHSLEHIPQNQLLFLLEQLASKSVCGARFIISVPNNQSYQYRWFGKSFAYYDIPNHLHQFSPKSLEYLLKQYDFYPLTTINSWPYNTFGYTQGLLNILTRTHNYLYYRLKRKSQQPSLWQDMLNGVLLPICVPLGWLLGLLDTMSLENQGVITVCFEKQ